MVLRFSILILLSCLTTTVSLSQNSLHYAGPYRVGSYTGKTEFDYKLLDGDTVLHGDFEMQQADLPSLLKQGDDFFSCRGSFMNHVPVGEWIFEFGKFNAGDRLELGNYKYKVNISGTLHSAKGMMLDGKPHGEWTHLVQHLDNSSVTENVFKSVFNFESGIPQRSFRIDNTDYSLLGRFLRDGLAHDVWSLYANETASEVENWQFSEGNLNKIYSYSGSNTDTINAYMADQAVKQVITLDDRYISILELHRELLQHSDTSVNYLMYGILEQHVEYYKQVSQIFTNLGAKSFTPAFKVKVKHFPLNDQEVQQVKSIRSNVDHSEIITERLLNNAQLNLLKLADEEVAYQYSAVAAINSEWLEPLRKLSRYDERDILTYISRSDLLSHLLPAGKNFTSLEVTYTVDNQTYTQVIESSLKKESIDRSDSLIHLKIFSEAVLERLEAIQSSLDSRILKQERQAELDQLERALYQRMKLLDQRVDSLATINDGAIGKTISSLKITGNEIVSEYSELKDISERINRADQLVNCLDSLNTLALEVSEVPARSAVINQEYMDRVWNPFTSTLMDEQIKKPVLEAYENILLPYLLEQVQNNITCDNLGELIAQLKNTNSRMLELKTENTRKLERKLKNQNDPIEVLQLLKIPAAEAN